MSQDRHQAPPRLGPQAERVSVIHNNVVTGSVQSDSYVECRIYLAAQDALEAAKSSESKNRPSSEIGAAFERAWDLLKEPDLKVRFSLFFRMKYLNVLIREFLLS